MNIFLCSTIRNLLFALLKAIALPNEKNVIFMICDQQNIDENNFISSYLPKHVDVVFFHRSDLRKDVYAGFQGKITKLRANAKIYPSLAFQKKIAQKIFNKSLKMNFSVDQLQSATLYLFNDRNKISRLFRLAFNEYHIIEDGLINYTGKFLSNYEKFVSFVSGSKKKMRYFGDDARCKSIFLLNPEKAPDMLKSKVKPVDFIDAESINKYCYGFFNFSTKTQPQYILATQALEFGSVVMDIYKKIIQMCQFYGFIVAIKPHPREDISCYLTEFPNTLIIDSKLPLELVIFGAETKNNILSIFSTSGLGFEEYCTRFNLIPEHELKNIDSLFSMWSRDFKLVETSIEKMFTELDEIKKSG